MESVAGKRVLITGAAMGMGRLYAERAVAEGAEAVVLWDIDEHNLKAVADSLAMICEATKLSVYVVDVGSREAVVEAAAAVRTEVGDPDIAINNAGIVRGNHYFWDQDLADAELTMKVNALAPMYVAHEFLPGMIGAREARLVNVASAAGLTSNPRMAAYAGSKWAAVGWSDSVRLELRQAGHKRVRVTTVCPYYVKTGMFEGAKAAGPLFPLLEPADVVEQVWQGMLKGKPWVVLPRTVWISELSKGILPTPLRDFASRALGIHRSMDHFTGR